MSVLCKLISYFPYYFPYRILRIIKTYVTRHMPMIFSPENPFVGPVPPTVHLPNSPLTSVLVQVRFPEILSIAKTEFIADFQESIRADYPLHRLDQNPVLDLELNIYSVRQGLIPNWRFFDKASQWRLSLTTSFVSLETRAYQSRLDFIRRIDTIVRALSTTIKPGMMTRIGVRYVDRIHGPQWEKLSHFIRPEILGPYTGDYRENLSRTLNEIICETDVGSMTSRWGYMPANQTHELELMPPISAPSWFLDIDAYNEFAQPEVFDADKIKTRVDRLATRAYGFFRWAVNDEFLKTCGGDI